MQSKGLIRTASCFNFRGIIALQQSREIAVLGCLHKVYADGSLFLMFGFYSMTLSKGNTS